IVPYIHKIEEIAQPTNVIFEDNKYITFTNNLDVNEFKYIIVYTSAKTNPTDIAYVNQTAPLKAEVVSGNQKRLDSTVVDLNKIAKLEIIVVGDGFNYINSLPCNVVLGSGTINKLVAPEITQLSNNMLMWKRITDLTHIKDFSLYVDGVLESSANITQTATDFNIESIVEKMKAGEHNFQIRANAADASYMSSALSNTYKIVKLNVNGLKMQGNTIVWENFANNQYGYKFIITDKAASEIVLSDVVEGKKGSGIYSHSPKLEIGKQYIVRIQLLGDTSKYFNSDFVELPYKLEKLDTVKSLQLQNGRISWTPDWRANGYTLQMNNMDIDKTFGAEVNIADEKVIYDKMLDNIKYSFGVKMNGGKVDSGIYYVESDIVSVKKKTDILVNEVATKLSAPSDLKLNTVGNLIWGSVVDADHYKIYYTDESGVQKLLATDVKGLILTDFSSILSGKVKLKAKAFGIGNNIESVFSNEIEANVLKTPTIKLINKENNIQIKFEQVVDGAGVPIKNYILKINDSVYPLGMADLTNYQTENGVVYYYYDINNADIDKPNTLILLGAEGNSTNIASQMCSIVKEDNIKLGKPQNITITGKYLVWNSVKNATQYRISVLTILDGSYQEVGNTIYTQISTGQQNFDITTLVGNYNQFRLQIVSLNPGVKGYLPSEPAEISSNKTKIGTITNYVVDGTVLKFDGSNFVKNVRIGITEGTKPEIEAFYPNSISGKYEIDLAKYLTTGGAYTVTVQMIATDAASNSDVVSITLTVLTMPKPKINELDKDSKIANGMIVWAYDETKTSYNIKITTGTAVRVVRLTFDKAASFSATNKIYDVKAEVLNTNGTVAETITTTSTFTDEFKVDVRSLINAGVHNIQIMTSITSANVAGSATQNCSSAYIDLGNFTKFADVKNIKASNNKISWDAVVGADVYYIYTINSSSVKTVTTTETQFIFNGTINNVSVPYQIYIVAGKANDTKNILSNNSVLFDLLQLSYPNNVRVENRIAKWDVVEGATGYLFKFGDIETVVNTNSYAMTDLSAKTTGIVPGTPGNIIIRALGKDNVFDSDFSVAKAYTAKMYAPTNIFYDKTNFMIMWDKVAGTSTDIAVDKYAITVKTYVGGVLSIYNLIDGAKTKTNSHTLSSALPDGSYVIEVVTIGNGFINSDPAISAISVQLDKVITFVVDEDTNKSFTVNCGLNNTLKRPADPTKPHNVFVGWKYYNGTSMVDFKFDGEAGAIKVAENYTITAQWKKIVTLISVTTLPTNLVYYIGDPLKLDGGKVTVNYEDGTAQEMVFTERDFNIPASVGEIGFKEMTISYKNAGYIPHEHGLLDTSLTTTFHVEVKIRY
ncbi:MAG: bacterial Ig-like domain-containing protein, partial [Clostridia bacterium]